MIKFPWKNSKESVNDSISAGNDIEDVDQSSNQVDSSMDNKINDESPSELLDTVNRSYKYADLPAELQSLVDQIKVADLQIQITKDTLSMIKPSRERIYMDLRERLKSVPTLKK